MMSKTWQACFDSAGLDLFTLSFECVVFKLIPKLKMLLGHFEDHCLLAHVPQ